MNTIMKVLTNTDTTAFTRALNEHLQDGWKVAGNSYNAESISNGAVEYSILLMINKPEKPEELAPDQSLYHATTAELLKATEHYKRMINSWNDAVTENCKMTDRKALYIDPLD